MDWLKQNLIENYDNLLLHQNGIFKEEKINICEPLLAGHSLFKWTTPINIIIIIIITELWIKVNWRVVLPKSEWNVVNVNV